MAIEAGCKCKTQVLPFVTNFVPRYRDARGDFEGVASRGTGAVVPDAVERFLTEYSENLQVFLVINDGKPDQPFEDMMAKACQELDTKRRKSLVHDMQRYLAKTLYAIKFPGGASQFEFVWPVVRNRGVSHGDSRISAYYYAWLDETKPPVKKQAESRKRMK